MDTKARTWAMIGLAGCSLLAAIGWAFTIYAFKATPLTHDLTVVGVNHTVNKAIFLFCYPVIQTWLCLMLLYPITTWNRFISNALQKLPPPDFSGNRRLTLTTWWKINCIGFCLVGGAFLYGAVKNALYVIKQM